MTWLPWMRTCYLSGSLKSQPWKLHDWACSEITNSWSLYYLLCKYHQNGTKPAYVDDFIDQERISSCKKLLVGEFLLDCKEISISNRIGKATIVPWELLQVHQNPWFLFEYKFFQSNWLQDIWSMASTRKGGRINVPNIVCDYTRPTLSSKRKT